MLNLVSYVDVGFAVVVVVVVGFKSNCQVTVPHIYSLTPSFIDSLFGRPFSTVNQTEHKIQGG